MKATVIPNYTSLALRLLFLIFCSCSEEDSPVQPITQSKYNIPTSVLNTIFTEEQLPAEEILDKIKKNGMLIHEGTTPPPIFTTNVNTIVGLSFTMEHTCIYDDQAGSNVGTVYGQYEQNIAITRNPDGSFAASLTYASVAHPDYPQYPANLDHGSGTGYATGNGNNFTLFFKITNGVYDNITYDAIWMISGTVSNFPDVREVSNITKCLVMLRKDNDPDDKVANPKTIRIFRDTASTQNQPDVVVIGFTPAAGSYGTLVTITGSGFSPNAQENVVRFNGVVASVQSGNAPNQLQVLVPKGAGTGPITVQVNSKTGTGGTFTYIPAYTVSTLVGNGNSGYVNGKGPNALFDSPFGITLDPEGSLQVSDIGNQVIRKITMQGDVSTRQECDDGECADIIFENPHGVATDASKNIYVAETGTNRVQIISSDGFVSSLEGGGSEFGLFINDPQGVAVDAQGTVYVTEMDNNDNIGPNIQTITSTGIVNTFADLTQNANGLALDANGNVYVAETEGHRILKISSTGIISVLAGNGQLGFADGSGTAASFNNPNGVAVDAQGNVYVADTGNHRIRKITPAGEVSTLAGTGQRGLVDGIGSSAQFNNPSGIAVDAQGNLYVADSQNHSVRKMILE
ncbi:SMP-30/gluconolactonase/LRE family protein [Adhaeribacter pallidiroseus]|uniref:RING-type E3 ubiquitin transferase n=1 Tax=Adhaeribacter pallidiroseus TaxID=2072847 RepID=A0A369QEG1_9BACT|nr:SMP-30/gluconolactonase/LRE family protein [Adhaeribacter pallidiroseus]RDC62700.1 RING-type E3 ubiquitin transferase [Adhaeribacter pallidiroseus]